MSSITFTTPNTQVLFPERLHLISKDYTNLEKVYEHLDKLEQIVLQFEEMDDVFSKKLHSIYFKFGNELLNSLEEEKDAEEIKNIITTFVISLHDLLTDYTIGERYQNPYLVTDPDTPENVAIWEKEAVDLYDELIHSKPHNFFKAVIDWMNCFDQIEGLNTVVLDNKSLLKRTKCIFGAFQEKGSGIKMQKYIVTLEKEVRSLQQETIITANDCKETILQDRKNQQSTLTRVVRKATERDKNNLETITHLTTALGTSESISKVTGEKLDAALVTIEDQRIQVRGLRADREFAWAEIRRLRKLLNEDTCIIC